MDIVINSLTDFIRQIQDNSKYIYSDNYMDKNKVGKPSPETFVEINNWIKKIKKEEDIDNVLPYIEKNKDLLYDYFLFTKKINKYTKKEMFFRGQANEKHRDSICPSIYRKGEKYDEQYYLNNMILRCPKELKNLNSISKLTYLQHYGCPTRLLDVTTNPLVALFFACESCEEENGEVIIFVNEREDILYDGSDKVAMLSKLAELDPNQKYRLQCLSYLYINKEKFAQNTNQEYRDSIVERFYHNIKKEYPAFERKINPIDLLRPIFVHTPLDNPRLLKQDGAFIMCGLDFDENDSHRKIKKLVYNEIIIPKNKKKEILKQLEMVGITEASLFPEVDKVASYLKNH